MSQLFHFLLSGYSNLQIIILQASQTKSALQNFYNNWLMPILQVLFLIIVAVFLIRTVAFFARGDERSMQMLFYLLGAVALWFGFNLTLGDFQTIF